MPPKILKPKNQEKKEALITVYLKNNEEIDYAYNDEKSDVIVENNRLIVGTISKIQLELLNLENETLEETKVEEPPKQEDGEDELD